jgi:PBSX family phage terminase large subunit
VPTEHGEVTIYLFGASDSASDDPLRGLTLDFWYADEITKHHMNFINEAMARLAAADRPLMIWTSNPENPQLPLYTDYTDRYHAMSDEEKAKFGGYHEFHFELKDNPIMTDAKIQKLALSYSGAEYDRKILGKRCVQEGLVYPNIDLRYFRPIEPGDVKVQYCAVDFGTDHATTMLFGGMFRGNKKDWRIVAEYYDKGSNKTPYDYYVDYLAMCDTLGIDPTKVMIAIDPAAKVLRIEFVKHGLMVQKAKNDVLNGINFTRTIIYNGILSFGEVGKLKHLNQELGIYAWDPKKSLVGVDAVIKQNDDTVDALRYFSYTFIRPVAGMMT